MEEQDFDTLLDLFISAERGWSSLDWISTLPEDILINIMIHFVDAVGCVSRANKAMHNICQSSALWKIHYIRTFHSLERTKGSDWHLKFQARWAVQKKLRNYHLFPRHLSPYPLDFDLLDVHDTTVAAHSNSDPITIDIVHLWDLRKDKPYALSPSPESTPCVIKLSTKHLAVGLTSGEAHIYHIASKGLLQTLPRPSKGCRIVSLDFHPIGGLVIGHSDGLASFWNGKDPMCIRKRAHDQPIHFIHSTVRNIFTAAQDGIRMWSHTPFEVLKGDMSPIDKMVVVDADVMTDVDPEGIYSGVEVSERLLGYCSYGQNISVWDLDQFKLIWTFSPFTADLSPVPLEPKKEEVEEQLWEDPFTDFYTNADRDIKVIEDMIILDDWIVVQACPIQHGRRNLFFVNKHNRTLVQPILNVSVVSVAKYDRWHTFTWHKNFSMCIWSGDQLLRVVTSRFLCHSLLRPVHIVENGFVGKSGQNLIYFEWEKPLDSILTDGNIDLPERRRVPDHCYFAGNPEVKETEVRTSENLAVEKRERETHDKDTKERKKQKLYDFWK